MKLSSNNKSHKINLKTVGKILAVGAKVPPKNKEQAEEQHIMKRISENLNGEKELAKEIEIASRISDPEEFMETFNNSDLGFAFNNVKRFDKDTMEDVPISFYEYQMKLMQSDATYELWHKGRRLGMTWGIALKGLIRAMRRVKYTAYYMSKNYEDAQDIIKYALEFYESIPADVKKDLASNSIKAQLEFDDGNARTISRLISHPQTQIRGKQGDITLDEFSYYLDQRGIYNAANNAISREGRIVVISTPRYKTDFFYSLAEGKSGASKGFAGNIYRIPWWHCPDMVAAGKFDLAQVECPDMKTAQRVERFGSERLFGIFNASESESDFAVEQECEYADDVTAFYPEELIEKVLFPIKDEQFRRTIDESHGKLYEYPMESKLLSLGIEPLFYENIDEFIRAVSAGKVGRYLVMGIDSGFADGCAISIFESTRQGIVIKRFQTKLIRVDFTAIKDLIFKILKAIPIKEVGIDVRDAGGRAMASEIKTTVSVIEIITNTDINNDMAIDYRNRMEKQTVALPDHESVRRDLKKVRRGYTPQTGMHCIEVSRDKKYGHGDNFFSEVYALRCLPSTTEKELTFSMPDLNKMIKLAPRTFERPAKKTIDQFRKIYSGKKVESFKVSRISDFDIIKPPSLIGDIRKLRGPF